MSGVAHSKRGLTILVIVVAVLLAVAILPWLIGGDRPAAQANQPTPGTPTQWRLVASKVHIDAPIRAIPATTVGTLNPPANPQDVGWWAKSARPGAATGRTVITGHTVHSGGGQMDHLGNLKPGDAVQVTADGGTIAYAVTQVFVLNKADVDRRANELVGQTRDPNILVLISCTGWTGSGYTSNVFVYAKPLHPAADLPTV